MRDPRTWPLPLEVMRRYCCSLSGKYALIGSIWETVVSSVAGVTRSPICATISGKYDAATTAGAHHVAANGRTRSQQADSCLLRKRLSLEHRGEHFKTCRIQRALECSRQLGSVEESKTSD